MRSIGKTKKERLLHITQEEIRRCERFGLPLYGVEAAVVAQLPEDWWDTWEGADAEIRRFISETVMEVGHA